MYVPGLIGSGGGSGGDDGDGGGDAQQSSPEYHTPAPKQLSWHVRALSHDASLLHLFARPQLQLQSRPFVTMSAVGVSVHAMHGGGAAGGGLGGGSDGGTEGGSGCGDGGGISQQYSAGSLK